MEDAVTLIAKAVLAGGPLAIISLLIGFIAYLLLAQVSLNKKLDQREREQDELFKEATEATKVMTEAICDLKVTISEIKGAISSK
ncbi:BhlA/UviB family holin-like peptide [Acetobacter tropicalis]|uniref:BhlA/UviB family holin-like peptide n=1 Tax=Acetobacter tropicalis TaxID=104102 RepID=UPI000586B8D8|nr:BhlA/UviB family holin-like peptide [Acetobacter tropicalis]